jgi:riboflavin synthase
MFTGMVQQLGVVRNTLTTNGSRRLELVVRKDNYQLGESIAVDGVCLTLVTCIALNDDMILGFDVSPETLACSRLAQLAQKHMVNIERSLKVGDTLGGHYVLGHVDTTAAVLEFHIQGEYKRLTIGDFWINASPYLIPKASMAVNGVSLTINQVTKESVTMMLIPHTLTHTNLGLLMPGDRVNIEFDYLARIVGHQLGMMQLSSKQGL